MLNEAIVQSLMDHTRVDSKMEGNLPIEEHEDKVLKEVMKMSEIEFKKQTGQLNLAHLKRKPERENDS